MPSEGTTPGTEPGLARASPHLLARSDCPGTCRGPDSGQGASGQTAGLFVQVLKRNSARTIRRFALVSIGGSDEA